MSTDVRFIRRVRFSVPEAFVALPKSTGGHVSESPTSPAAGGATWALHRECCSGASTARQYSLSFLESQGGVKSVFNGIVASVPSDGKPPENRCENPGF